jgi:flagellar basal body-associated protein FliL
MRKKMTKSIKIVITGITLLCIAVLIAAAFYFAGLSDKKDKVLNVYMARREELLAQQQSLEALIADLNKTMRREQVINQRLAQTLQNLTQQKAIIDKQAAQNTVIASPQPALAPAPLIPPPAPRVTRAS